VSGYPGDTEQILFFPRHVIFPLSSRYPENTLHGLAPGMDSLEKRVYCCVTLHRVREIVRRCRSVLSGSRFLCRQISIDEQG